MTTDIDWASIVRNMDPKAAAQIDAFVKTIHEDTMTPEQYIIDAMKQYIIDALSAAADNAHDMTEIDSDYELDCAVGVIVIDVLGGDGDSALDGGYFDEDQDVPFTKNDVKPYLIDAISDFLSLIRKQHQAKTPE
jgi:hypothetical protein